MYSMCCCPSLNSVLSPETQAESDLLLFCLQSLPAMCVSFHFWCQRTPNSRLNTHSSKISKCCTAFQIHYGSEVSAGLTEHPMERTANGHRLLTFISIVSKVMLGIEQVERNCWICSNFVSNISSTFPSPRLHRHYSTGPPLWSQRTCLLGPVKYSWCLCAEDPNLILMTLFYN